MSPGLCGGRGTADYAALFTWLRDTAVEELEVLRSQHNSVRPALFVLLCGSAPRDDAWQTPHRRLLATVRRGELVAFGVDAAAEAAADLASYPQLGFTPAGPDRGRAVGLFAAFLHQHLVELGQAALDGTEAPTPAPSGFRSPE